jgi:hypothetical protein
MLKNSVVIKIQVIFYCNEGEKMIVIFPLLVSKNVNTNLVQGIAVTLERYIASYAISDFVGKQKEFNKYYNYKMKGGKIYQESESTWFDLDPLTKGILEKQEALREEILDKYGNPIKNIPKPKPNKPKKNWGAQDVDRSAGEKAAARYLGSKGKAPDTRSPKEIEFDKKKEKEAYGAAITGIQTADDARKAGEQWWKDAKQGRADKKNQKKLDKPGFTSASLSKAALGMEPTWITVKTKEGVDAQMGIKVVPMMIEGFNIKHTIADDMAKYFLTSFLSGIGRKTMRLLYKLVDRWTYYGQRPRGDVRQDLFYARTGHDGQPFVLLDKNQDIPKFFFSQPQHLLKLWKLSWGNLLIADDHLKTVMFCMKKYKGMCSNFSYSMVFNQVREMGKVFEDMEDARKATGSLFKMNKKISSFGGK